MYTIRGRFSIQKVWVGYVHVCTGPLLINCANVAGWGDSAFESLKGGNGELKETGRAGGGEVGGAVVR